MIRLKTASSHVVHSSDATLHKASQPYPDTLSIASRILRFTSTSPASKRTCESWVEMQRLLLSYKLRADFILYTTGGPLQLHFASIPEAALVFNTLKKNRPDIKISFSYDPMGQKELEDSGSESKMSMKGVAQVVVGLVI